jgi:hypothetical protein
MATMTAQQMEAALFLDQVRAMSLKMGDEIKDGMDLNDEQVASLKELIERHIASVDVDDCLEQVHQAKPKRGKAKGGGTRARKEVAVEDQCHARVWGDGSGHSRCSFTCASGADYCKKHGKLAAVTCEPCQNDPATGAKIGLHFGRYDSWQDGEEGVIPYKDSSNVIRIEWSSDEMKARVQSDLTAGDATRAPGAKTGKAGRKKKVVEAALAAEATSAQELQNVLEEVSTVVDEMPVVNDSPANTPSFEDADVNGDGVVDKEELEKVHNTVTPDPVVGGNKEDGVDEDDDEDEMEVVEKVWNGETFLVDEKTNQIIDEDDVVAIGTWDDDTGPKFD